MTANLNVQNLSGSASYDRAPKHPELAGLSTSFSIPAKLQFTISWNYISQAALGVKNAVDSAAALVLSPQNLPVPKDTAGDANEPKWEMVIPKISRPAKPAATPAAPAPAPQIAAAAPDPVPVESHVLPRTEDVSLLRQLAERYRTLLLTMAIGGLFGLILVLWAGGPSH